MAVRHSFAVPVFHLVNSFAIQNLYGKIVGLADSKSGEESECRVQLQPDQRPGAYKITLANHNPKP